jgi:hypothetical protein
MRAKFILLIAVASVLAVSPAMAWPSKGSAKQSSTHPNVKKIEATVVTMTSDTIVVRSGNKDEVFKIDSSTQKSPGIAVGNKVTVNYKKESGRYVATDIELSAAN